MPEKAKEILNCPKCGETTLPEDKFCFHCGRRLQPKVEDAVPASHDERVRRHFPQWPLALAGVFLIVLTGYVVHHQETVIHGVEAGTTATPVAQPKGTHVPAIRPVVTTTTTYPSGQPSLAGWTSEVETYDKVQLHLRIPANFGTLLSSSPTEWRWGSKNSVDGVILQVVSSKPVQANVALGPATYGTAIVRTSGQAEQALYINWDHHQWVMVQMTVPSSRVDWLGAIAKSVGVS